MMKPCHMTMPRGKGGQLVRESCEKGSRHGPKFGLRSHEEGIPGGGRAGWLGRRRLVALAGDGTREWNGDLELAP